MNKYNYDKVINANNPLLSNKGTPSVIEKHKRELRELFDAIQKMKDDREVKGLDSTKVEGEP